MISNDELDTAIARATNWLFNSGIQNLDESSKQYGATAAWYDMEMKKNSFLYSEVAGYSITAHCYLNSIDDNPEHIKRAELAADWLERESYDGTGYRCRLNPGEEDFVAWLCSFDNAMILNGLANLYRHTEDEKYLQQAKRTADWLIAKMQNEDGSFKAKLDAKTGAEINTPERWSGQPGVIHAKHAIGLANLFGITGDERYRASAEKVCDWSLEHLQGDGRFVTNPVVGDTYMHPHCYAIEGLLAAVKNLKINRYLPDAMSAGAWILRGMNKKGGISQNYDGHSFSVDEHTDSMTQSARIWMILSSKPDFEIDKRILAGVIDRILKFQCASEDQKTDGGFYYGTVDGRLRRHVSNHCTMFALQTLIMYRDYQAGQLDFDMLYYV